MNRRLLLVGTLLVVACTDPEGELAGTVSTKLSGSVFLGEPGRRFAVEVFELLDGSERIAAQAEIEDSTFEIDLGVQFGRLRVHATSDAQEQLSAIVDVALDEEQAVYLTPVTHLAAVLEAREEVGGPSSKRLVYDHFLGLAHDQVRPFNLASEVALSLTDDVAAGFLLEAIRTLARGWSEGRTVGAVSTGRLLDALSADLSADGLFDGLGEGGRAIVVGGRRLDSVVLRADLGRALLSYAASDENTSAFLPSDLVPMAEALAFSRSPLFGADTPEPLDNRGPEFRRWFFTRDGEVLRSEQPLHGVVQLELELEDEGRVERVTFSATGVEVENRSIARFDFDTTSLPDGPGVAQVVAVDDSGNTSTLTIRYDVDNTGPVLTVKPIGPLAVGEARVEGIVRSVEGAATVRVLLGGEELARREDVEGGFSFTVQVPCGQRFTLVVQAVERSGNVTEVRQEVVCDATPPVIEVLPSSFIQEDSLVAVHVSDGAEIDYRAGPEGVRRTRIDALTTWPIRISKYLNRLDDLDAVGTADGGTNIPRIRFRALEVDGQQVASHWADLVVEYRYRVRDREVRPFTRLQPIGGLPEYEVPISYQALGPELASAGPAAAHAVEVRVTDEAGHTALLSFPFNLDLLSPPARLSDCRLSSFLEAFQLGAQNMGALYGSLPEAEAAIGRVSYPLHLSPGSLLSPVSVRLLFEGARAQTRVTQLREDTHFAYPSNPANDRPTPCAYGMHWEIQMPQNEDLGCFIGAMPLDRLLSQDQLGLNDGGDVHRTRFEVHRRSAVLPAPSNGGYLIEPDLPAEVRVQLVAPRVHFDGVVYDWRQALNLPSGYAAGPFAPRHRVDATWHEGVSLRPFGSIVDPDRAYVTRPYIKMVELEIDSMSLSASIEGRDDLVVGVQVEPECLRAHIHRTMAP